MSEKWHSISIRK